MSRQERRKFSLCVSSCVPVLVPSFVPSFLRSFVRSADDRDMRIKFDNTETNQYQKPRTQKPLTKPKPNQTKTKKKHLHLI